MLFLCWAVAALVVWAVRDQEVGRGEGGRGEERGLEGVVDELYQG